MQKVRNNTTDVKLQNREFEWTQAMNKAKDRKMGKGWRQKRPTLTSHVEEAKG